MKDKFTFQREFLEIADSLEDSTLRIKYIEAVINYGLNGIEPDDQLLRSLIVSAKLKINKQKEISKIRSDNMKGNKNSKKDWNKLGNNNKTEKSEITEVDTKNRDNQKNQKGQKDNLTVDNGKKLIDKESTSIYNIININLYNIIKYFITNKSLYPQISYQIEKKGLDQYLNEQYKYGEKLEKLIGIDSLKSILKFCLVDGFRKNQILSIKKLLDKNKDNIPYYLIISEKILQSNQIKTNVSVIPTV